MHNEFNRRHFIQKSALASAVATAGWGFEEKALRGQAAYADEKLAAPARKTALQRGKIGNVSLSRMICGGNLIAGFAHSRDLIYVSEVLKHYFTDAKVLETLQLCEVQGVNTAILRLDADTLRILNSYRKERQGKIQWIAQIEIKESEMGTQIKQAVDNGAVGVFTHGGIGDDLVKRGRVEVLGKALQLIREERVIAGIAGHQLAVPMACEEAGIHPDFYMKTFNSKSYWSAGPIPRHDSVWAETPQETAAFMQEIDIPWIAYKVLGAGAIHPQQGFQYAFQNGADFICVGMFDFQVAEDVQLAQVALEKTRRRDRPWCGVPGRAVG